jgi:hypothetical protein
MAANTIPIFPLAPNTPVAVVTATTTDKTGATTTNMVDLVTGATDGTKVTQISYKCQGTSVAALLLIFITDNAGANPKLYDEILIAAVTTSNTTPTDRAVNLYDDLQLKAGQKIKVGVTALSGNVNVWASTGDYNV